MDDAPGRGWYSSLALDSAGNPHIACSGNREWDLRHAWCEPGFGWRFETIGAAGNVGLCCWLKFTSNSLGRISYFDSTNKSLEFAWQQPDGAWTTEVVDGSADAGIDTSLTLDDVGNPHVAYLNLGDGGLYYAEGWSFLPGDMDGSGAVNNNDVTPFVLALTDRESYLAAYPRIGPDIVGDLDADGELNNNDIAPFIALLTGEGSGAIPEPFGAMLLAVGWMLVPNRPRLGTATARTP